MLSDLSPTRRNLALLAVAALVLWFAWTVRSALNPLLLALMFAYMLHPMVLSLEARGWTRRHAVNAIYGVAAVTALLVSVGVFLQARSLWIELVDEGDLVARIEQGVSAAIEDVEGGLRGLLGEESSPAEPTPDSEGVPTAAAADPLSLGAWVAELREWISAGQGSAAAKQAGNLWALVRRLFGSLLSFAVLAFLVPVYTWFLLFELERIQSFVREYVPVGDRDRVARIGTQIAEVLGNFFRGRLLVCLIKGLLLAGVLAALKVPYAFLLGMLSGFLSLIPFAGPAVGYGAAFLLALLEHAPLGAAWRVGLVFAVGELVEGYVLLPRILGDTLGLHPLVVFLSLTVAGAALGMFGVLLALPLMAAAIILTRELVLPLAREWAEGRRAEAGS